MSGFVRVANATLVIDNKAGRSTLGVEGDYGKRGGDRPVLELQ